MKIKIKASDFVFTVTYLYPCILQTIKCRRKTIRKTCCTNVNSTVTVFVRSINRCYSCVKRAVFGSGVWRGADLLRRRWMSVKLDAAERIGREREFEIVNLMSHSCISWQCERTGASWVFVITAHISQLSRSREWIPVCSSNQLHMVHNYTRAK